ncbi:LOW QUALITY PROTEIN: long-chain fatty acid transport protein 6 [Aegotheles albertisi]
MTSELDGTLSARFISLKDSPVETIVCEDTEEIIESEREREQFEKEFMKAYIEDLKERDLLGTLEEILSNLQKDVSVWKMTKDCTFPSVHTLLDKIEAASENPVLVNQGSANNLMSSVLYIFTSGTTGATSASQFWSDCKKYDVTVIQYIGELCRYLCSQPVKEEEKIMKLAVGNGVRNDVWKEFLDRFGAAKICEFYGATEGNIYFMNHTGKIGSVGRTNFFYKLFFPFDLIKYDVQNDKPIRNKHGWCEKIRKLSEVGLLISRVNAKNPFFGYAVNKRHTEKKLHCEVFNKGDIYFNTGDLIVQDHENFLYFWDRIGDTFRWKGENVATIEVSDVIVMLHFIQEANVYGVSVPALAGIEITFFIGVHMVLCFALVAKTVLKKMEMTGRFKQQKFHLVDGDFNPSTITDPLYFLDNSEKAYVLLTKEVHEKILSGKMKL